MITYILKSVTCLALLMAFYHLFLEREKMHNFNRFYLLGSVVFSFLAPLFIIYIDAAPVILNTIETAPTYYTPEIISSDVIVEKPIDYTSIFIIIYSIISSVLLIRFGRNIFNIINKTRKNTKIPYQKAILVLVDDKILPHSFWNYIFINKESYENNKIEQELFTHELTHVTQKHTLDVLILELLHSIFWINPLFILLKKAVQLNHEFLADETVINQHKNTFHYQHLLVNKAAWKNDYYLASNLNYSLTKKRLKMMTTQSSPTKILLKKLAIIPLLTGFIFLFAERVEAQEIIEVKEYLDAPIKDLQLEDLDPNDIRVKLKDVNNLKISYLDKDTIIEIVEENKNPNSDLEIRWIIEELDNQYDLNSYKELNKTYESERNKEPHFVESSEKRQKGINDLFSKLGSMYFKLSKEDKKKAKRPIHPHKPYVRLMKNNKVFYKLRKDLTEEDKLLLPPPPIPKDASDLQKENYKKAHKDWQERTGNTLEEIPPAPSKNRKNLKGIKESKNVGSSLKVKDTIPTKKEDAKITLQNKNTLEKLSFVKALEKLNKEEKGKIKEKVTYYLDDMEIEFEDLNAKIKPYEIESTRVENNKDGSEKIYITSKKGIKPISNSNIEKDKKETYKFSVILEKDNEKITMFCKKGCEWEKLEFDLKLNSPQIVNKYGLNKVNQRNRDDSFYFVLLQDKSTFDLKSTKNTKWKGLSGSSKEKMKLLIDEKNVKSKIK